jgi:hypothetical protein
MHEYDKTEVAFKNGYDKGMEDAINMGYAVGPIKTVNQGPKKENGMVELNAKTVGGICNSLNALEGVYHDEKTMLPTTIVYWADGSKTVVKCENEKFDPDILHNAQDLIWTQWDKYKNGD